MTTTSSHAISTVHLLNDSFFSGCCLSPPKIDDFSSSIASRRQRTNSNSALETPLRSLLQPDVQQRLSEGLVVSNKNYTAENEAERNNPTGPRDGIHFADIFLHFRTHTENKHVQKAKIPLFLFLAVVMMAFSFARQSCCCCSAVCSFHTAAHIIFYFFHFSSLIFDSCTHKHAHTSK